MLLLFASKQSVFGLHCCMNKRDVENYDGKNINSYFCAIYRILIIHVILSLLINNEHYH